MSHPSNQVKALPVRGLFLVWGYPKGTHRSQLISNLFNMPCQHVYVTDRQGWFWALIKYPLQALMTPCVLLWYRPQVIFVQNPPIFSTMLVYLWGLLTGSKFIIDSHTDALLASWWAWSLPYHRFLSQRAITTIITNEHLEKLVTEWDAHAFILVNPPEIHSERAKVDFPDNSFNVVLISSASYDEPVANVLEAAKKLPEVQFHITGSYDTSVDHKKIRENSHRNVRFTGYLSDSEFYGLLEAADVIMALTTENHTIQSGAAEALSLSKPLITSDWPLLRNYFTQGAVLVDNTASEIAQAIVTIQDNLAQFRAEAQALQEQRRLEWQQQANRLIDFITQTVNQKNSS